MTPASPSTDSGLGLRLKIWLGCLAGALVSGAGVWLAIGWASQTGIQNDSALLWVWLPIVGAAGILVALAMALWLDHGVVTPLRGFSRALVSGRVNVLRGLPSQSGWGEISTLTQQLQGFLARHQQNARASESLERMHRELLETRARVEAWLETERWEPLPAEEGVLGDVLKLVNDGAGRAEALREQNRHVAEQLQSDIEDSSADARESAEQTERVFVEATALLTTIRELERLTGDLAAVAPPTAVAPVRIDAAEAATVAGMRAAAGQAIRELADASGASVRHLADGLSRVRDLSDQVQVLGNRATLLALNVMVGHARPDDAAQTDLARDLRELARDVRGVTERTSQLTQEVERDVALASERMHGVRERVVGALERLPASELAEQPAAEPARAAGAPAKPAPDAARLLERVREMVHDATRKGERLSSAGERASRAAERLTRRMEETLAEIEGLIVRLSPVETPARKAPSSPLPRTAESPARGPDGGALRLLGKDDAAPRPGERERDRRP